MPDQPTSRKTADQLWRRLARAAAERERVVAARAAERKRAERERIERALAESGRRELIEQLTREVAAGRLAPEEFQEVLAQLGPMRVSIYLADEDIHGQVETAVEQWLATADVFIDSRRRPVIGSWFRRMNASVKSAARTSAAREALLTGIHIADSHLVQAQDAYVTSTLLQNVGPVLQALQPTKDAVVRAGALLIVKVEWVVQVHQLTAAQQAILDHRRQLAASPREIIAALQLPDPVCQEGVLQSAVQRIGGGEKTATTAD